MKRPAAFIITLMLSLGLASCFEQEQTQDDRLRLLKLETLPEVAHPNDNPSSPEKVVLGKLLFFDPILSGEKDVACATCHHPNYGYTDGLDLSIGVGGKGLSTNRIEGAAGRIPIVGRNAPTVINAAYNGLLNLGQHYNPLLAPMFWDGRAKSLESQSLGPPTSYNEMRGSGYSQSLTYDSIVARLKNIPGYVSLFNNAFPGEPNSISKENLGKAIAAFERTIVSKNSPYDRYVKGDLSALTENQKIGLMLFYGKANCATCHSGPAFSDYNYYNLGIENNGKLTSPDNGLDEKHLFRTPTLRNVTLTSPFMHNGVHATLEEVMDYYNHGIAKNTDISSIDPKIKPLHLSSEEMNSIIAFMGSLTDDGYDKTIPDSVPSGLKPGGN